MELKNSDKLQILTATTLDLHRRINEKINEHGFSFCSHCSNHGRYCVVAADDESSPDEREKMISIRDSLKELHALIISLQNVRSAHRRQMEEALGRVEESRKEVIARVKRCSKEERGKFDVIEEVIEFVGDGSESSISWEMDDQKVGPDKNGVCSFLVRTMRFGLEFVVVFATIYMWRSRQQNLQRNVMDSRIQTADSGLVQLDVLCGRG